MNNKYKQNTPEDNEVLEQLDLLSEESRKRAHENWGELHGRIRRRIIVHRIWNVCYTSAAVLVLPLLLSLILVESQLNEKQKAMAEVVETTASYGVSSKIILPDSSIVWLNSGSTLTYPRHFLSQHRRVVLSGEAYFKVKSDRQRQFTVVVPGHAQVNAYGTEFNVTAYKSDSFVEATLSKGHVDVITKEGRWAKLTPGESAFIDKDGNRMSVRQTDLWEKTAWREGKMVFRRASIETVANSLSRHYNVDFVLKGNGIDNYEFSATFTNENIHEVLDILKMAAPLNYSIQSFTPNKDMSYPRQKITVVLN